MTESNDGQDTGVPLTRRERRMLEHQAAGVEPTPETTAEPAQDEPAQDEPVAPAHTAPAPALDQPTVAEPESADAEAATSPAPDSPSEPTSALGWDDIAAVQDDAPAVDQVPLETRNMFAVSAAGTPTTKDPFAMVERPAARPEPRKKTKRGGSRNTLAGIIVLGLIAVLVAGAWWGWATFGDRIIAQFSGPEDFAGPGHGEVMVHVEEGDIGSDVGAHLVDAGVIASVGAFVEAMEAHPSPNLMPGTYSMLLEMSAADALDRILDDANLVQVSAVIPEGYVVTRVYDRLAEATGIPVEDFVTAGSDPQSFGLPDEAVSIEGYLFPATYDFAPGLDAHGILQVMVDRMFQALDEHGVPEADRFRVLTFASLIQREAGPIETFGQVACVFQNRLNIGMLLQSDATVAYGTGNLHVVTTTSEERADPSNPYNTYVHPGLPVGPIGAPGDVAIQAALTPDACPYLYFVTVNPETGETVFSETLAEHDAAAQRFYDWLAENPEWGE